MGRKSVGRVSLTRIQWSEGVVTQHGIEVDLVEVAYIKLGVRATCCVARAVTEVAEIAVFREAAVPSPHGNGARSPLSATIGTVLIPLSHHGAERRGAARVAG